jgi:hypothetical protein
MTFALEGGKMIVLDAEQARRLHAVNANTSTP